MTLRFATVPVLFAAITLALAVGAPRATAGASSVSGVSTPCVHAERAAAAEVHRAAIVITFGDTSTKRFCVEFTEDSITGLDLLKRSGVGGITTDTSGNAVCAIGGEGSDVSTDCFKFCKSGGSCQYWAYYQWKNSAWQFSQLGPGLRVVRDGDTDGWAWGSGSVSGGATPADPGGICPPTATATPATTPQPSTVTPIPATAEPTSTGQSANTPGPTATPRTATTSAAATSPAESAGPTAAGAPPIAGEAAGQEGSAGGAASETRVNAVAGAARTPPASASPSPSMTASPGAPTGTPMTGVAIVEADAGLRNASSAQRREGTGFDIVPLAGFGSVALALAAAGGYIWYRRRQFDA